MPPADDLGGGASRALRHPEPEVADRPKLGGYATNNGLSVRSGETGGTGATAGAVPRIRQQAGMILVPRFAPPCAISPQQEGRAVDCIASTQADAGIAVHKTATASTSNANFLPQCIVGVPSSTLSIHLGFAGACVHHHTPEN